MWVRFMSTLPTQNKRTPRSYLEDKMDEHGEARPAWIPANDVCGREVQQQSTSSLTDGEEGGRLAGPATTCHQHTPD